MYKLNLENLVDLVIRIVDEQLSESAMHQKYITRIDDREQLKATVLLYLNKVTEDDGYIETEPKIKYLH